MHNRASVSELIMNFLSEDYLLIGDWPSRRSIKVCDDYINVNIKKDRHRRDCKRDETYSTQPLKIP